MFGIIGRRNWALRLSIVLNIGVLLYVCASLSTVSNPWVESSSNWVTQAQVETVYNKNILNTSITVTREPLIYDEKNEKKVSLNQPINVKKNDTTDTQTISQTKDKTIEHRSLREAIPCDNKHILSKTVQRGEYWVLQNYVPMNMKVNCWESVTYTTHADYTFLDNLRQLLERWQAPVSIALYAPGTDFLKTVEAIKYARSCEGPLVSQMVTFHIYFSSKHLPKTIIPGYQVASEKVNCSRPAPWINVTRKDMYKSERKLLYPVNVGRNIAREAAATYYVLASDIELYPSPGLPMQFLEMIRRRNQSYFYRPNPKVYVLSIFEVDEKYKPPENKTRLLQMLKAGTAIPFHKKLCAGCHKIPHSKEWQEAEETKGLHIFHIGKRISNFVHWEPIFIGTNSDPMYDERLSWEGKSDKMTQGYILCVLDYDFMILDNAFLVHRPGIKTYKKDNYRDTITAKTNILIKKIIFPELRSLYGYKKECAI